MPGRVSVCEDLHFIQVQSYGDVSTEDLKVQLEAVAKIRRERGLTRVFIDATRETSFPSTIPIFDFGAEIARALGGVRLAVVASPKTRRETRFLETVAVNRGASLRVFDTVDAAMTWLLSDTGVKKSKHVH